MISWCKSKLLTFRYSLQNQNIDVYLSVMADISFILHMSPAFCIMNHFKIFFFTSIINIDKWEAVTFRDSESLKMLESEEVYCRVVIITQLNISMG